MVSSIRSVQRFNDDCEFLSHEIWILRNKLILLHVFTVSVSEKSQFTKANFCTNQGSIELPKKKKKMK